MHRVLIVDDEQVIANTLEAILRSNGYEARTAYSAEQALELIAEWQPAFAIVDVILPQLNGIEFCKLLRAQFPACGFLLISGETLTGELLEQAEKDGQTFEVVAKPVHPNVLLERAAAMLGSPRDQPVVSVIEGAGPSVPVSSCTTAEAPESVSPAHMG
jgi:DNA-binding response OmpR family regulator